MDKLKLEWYSSVAEYIQQNMHDTYRELYGVELKRVGDCFRVNICPVCGHKDCCTTKENIVNCFSGSCDWKGNQVTAWISYAKNIKKMSFMEAIKKLEKITGLKFPGGDTKSQEKIEKHYRKQEILKAAREFYHNQLLVSQERFSFKGKGYTAIEYLQEVRGRKISTLKDFKIGLSGNYLKLYNTLADNGYSKEEIKDAKIWIPDNLIVFFYSNPITRDIVRINTKNPFEQRYSSQDGSQGELIKGFSTNSKSMYFPDDFDFKGDILIVEGEHDLFAIYEQGFKNVCAIGGNIERENQLYMLKRVDANIVYLMFDNDDAGDVYTTVVNDYLADKDIRKINYGERDIDPDEYFMMSNRKTIEELLSSAEILETDSYVVNHFNNKWSIGTRGRKLEFILKSKNDKGTLVGSLSYYQNNKLDERSEDASLLKAKAKVKPLNFYLHDEMENFFNTDLEKRELDELVDIFRFSSSRQKIVKILAEHIHKSDDHDKLVNYLKIRFNEAIGQNDIVDNVLKELNDIQNKSTDISFTDIPKMKICQFFSARNNDAYIYFTYVKEDGDVKRKLPFLLRNDGTLIRLDLLKRKDSQCLLLIDNKYELPFEVNDAILDLRECSLTQTWVEKWRNNEIPRAQLDPGYLVREIERYIRKFYFTANKHIYKVLALYIYTTYFYELFGQIPYLFLNGEKGSGKSILDTVIYMLAFDAKMAIDISDACLFRMAAIEGGTMILDEMENLTSRKSTQDSTMASVLKGGYSKSGQVYRTNVEKGINEGFNVYGPRVISNIFGLDDVIEDRCIQINSYRMKLTKETKLEDPKYYLSERLDEIKELTSKCALSTLVYFRQLFDIYNDSLFVTGNARLYQILTPVLAIARLADSRETGVIDNPSTAIIGEYEKSLREFYKESIESSKDTVDSDTPEGIIKKSVSTIAREIYGLVPAKDLEYIITTNHKYTEAIKYNKEEGWFEVNLIHFKCFIEESIPGDRVYTKIVSRWVKTCFNFKAKDIKRKTVHIDNDELMKELNNNRKMKVFTFRFYFKDFIDFENEFLSPSKPLLSNITSEDSDKLF
ncbi:MAG: toprim domain-containing protein [Paraclostridium sp.]